MPPLTKKRRPSAQAHIHAQEDLENGEARLWPCGGCFHRHPRRRGRRGIGGGQQPAPPAGGVRLKVHRRELRGRREPAVGQGAQRVRCVSRQVPLRPTESQDEALQGGLERLRESRTADKARHAAALRKLEGRAAELELGRIDRSEAETHYDLYRALVAKNDAPLV